jgi:hypothetical protein
MITASVVILALQAVQAFQVLAVYALHNTVNDEPFRNALFTLATLLVISCIGRVASCSMWLLGMWKGKRLFRFYGGKLALLLVTAVSTYASAVAMGAVIVDMTVIPKSRTDEKNVDTLVVFIVATLMLVVLETMFSHGVQISREKNKVLPKISWKTMPHVVVVVIVIVCLFALQLVSMGLQTMSFSTMSKAAMQPELSTAQEYAAKELTRALKGGFIMSLFSLFSTFLLLLVYGTKALVHGVDKSQGGKVLLLIVTASVWLMSSLSYGCVLPGASILSIYEKRNDELLDTPGGLYSVTAAIALTSTSFWLQFVTVLAIHVASFLRVRAQENEEEVVAPADEADAPEGESEKLRDA